MMRGLAPFTFTAFPRDFVGADQVFAGDLTGSGRVVMIYVTGVTGAYEWEEGVARFFFSDPEPAPVPEPATLLMAGLGAAALMTRRFRRPRQPSAS